MNEVTMRMTRSIGFLGLAMLVGSGCDSSSSTEPKAKPKQNPVRTLTIHIPEMDDRLDLF